MAFPAAIQEALNNYEREKGFGRKLKGSVAPCIEALYALGDEDKGDLFCILECFWDKVPKARTASYKVYTAVCNLVCLENPAMQGTFFQHGRCLFIPRSGDGNFLLTKEAFTLLWQKYRACTPEEVAKLHYVVTWGMTVLHARHNNVLAQYLWSLRELMQNGNENFIDIFFVLKFLHGWKGSVAEGGPSLFSRNTEHRGGFVIDNLAAVLAHPDLKSLRGALTLLFSEGLVFRVPPSSYQLTQIFFNALLWSGAAAERITPLFVHISRMKSEVLLTKREFVSLLVDCPHPEKLLKLMGVLAPLGDLVGFLLDERDWLALAGSRGGPRIDVLEPVCRSLWAARRLTPEILKVLIHNDDPQAVATLLVWLVDAGCLPTVFSWEMPFSQEHLDFIIDPQNVEKLETLTFLLRKLEPALRSVFPVRMLKEFKPPALVKLGECLDVCSRYLCGGRLCAALHFQVACLLVKMDLVPYGEAILAVDPDNLETIHRAMEVLYMHEEGRSVSSHPNPVVLVKLLVSFLSRCRPEEDDWISRVNFRLFFDPAHAEKLEILTLIFSKLTPPVVCQIAFEIIVSLELSRLERLEAHLNQCLVFVDTPQFRHIDWIRAWKLFERNLVDPFIVGLIFQAYSSSIYSFLLEFSKRKALMPHLLQVIKEHATPETVLKILKVLADIGFFRSADLEAREAMATINKAAVCSRVPAFLRMIDRLASAAGGGLKITLSPCILDAFTLEPALMDRHIFLFISLPWVDQVKVNLFCKILMELGWLLRDSAPRSERDPEGAEGDRRGRSEYADALVGAHRFITELLRSLKDACLSSSGFSSFETKFTELTLGPDARTVLRSARRVPANGVRGAEGAGGAGFRLPVAAEVVGGPAGEEPPVAPEVILGPEDAHVEPPPPLPAASSVSSCLFGFHSPSPGSREGGSHAAVSQAAGEGRRGGPGPTATTSGRT